MPRFELIDARKHRWLCHFGEGFDRPMPTLQESIDAGPWRSFPGLIKPVTGWVPSTPAIIIPKVSLPVAAGLVLGAVIVKNPVVSRRFWRGWLC